MLQGILLEIDTENKQGKIEQAVNRRQYLFNLDLWEGKANELCKNAEIEFDVEKARVIKIRPKPKPIDPNEIPVTKSAQECITEFFERENTILQNYKDFMENHPECSMCFHRSQELIEGVNVPFVFSHLKEGYYSGEDILNRWTIPTASVLYRNYGASFQQFCPGIMWRDIFLFLLLADRGRLYCLPDVMSVYRRNAGSVTLQQKRTLPYKRIVGHYKALKKFFPGKYDKIFDQKIMMSYIRQVKAHPFSWESIRSMFFCLIHPIMAVRGFAKILRDRNHRVYQ